MRLIMCLLCLVLLACDESPGLSSPQPVSEISTQIPVEIGVLHNQIMARMKARTLPGQTMSRDELARKLAQVTNKVLEQYKPSREVTEQDIQYAYWLHDQFVAPYFDVTGQDPNRADIRAVFKNLKRLQVISELEYEQLVSISAGIEPTSPASQGIIESTALYKASVVYWTSGKIQAGAEDDIPVKSIQSTLGDWAGGLIGWALGAGTPIGATIGAALSLMFTIGGNAGDGGIGSNDGLPCGGYQGVGPCPD